MNCALFATLLAIFIATASADVTKGGFGASKTPEISAPAASSGEAPRETKRNSYPFHGTLASADIAGKTITLEGKKKPRVIRITAETRFFRNSAKAKLNDAIAGERVTGTVRKNAAGQEEAITVRFGGAARSRK